LSLISDIDKQHVMIMGIMGKYPPPLADVLADEGPLSEQKAVLDLGCGSGAWHVIAF
jgi:ribosomal protein L11 methylase PrmA